MAIKMAKQGVNICEFRNQWSFSRFEYLLWCWHLIHFWVFEVKTPAQLFGYFHSVDTFFSAKSPDIYLFTFKYALYALYNLMPLSFYGFQNVLCHTKRWFLFSKFGFCASTKVFEEALNAIKCLDWHKTFRDLWKDKALIF